MRYTVNLLLGTVAIAAAIGFGIAQTRAVAADTPAADVATGHCDFKLKNQWVGPLKSCMAPASAAQCASLGKENENSDAVWTEGACATASLVGTCKKPTSALNYYEGDAGGLEVGCGFQGGEWHLAGK